MARTLSYDVVVLGGANTDFLVKGPRLPVPGETLEGTVFLESPGGKGANQAVAAARLGASVALVARIGSDARGDALLARLVDEGVDVHLVARDGSEPTGAALVLVSDGGQKSIFTALGANRRLTFREDGPVAAAIGAARALLAQLEVPLEAVEVAARLAHAAGAKVILDPAPARPLSDELLSRVDLLKPNATEAQLLTGRSIFDRGSARWAAELLLARGARAVSVQAGNEGDLLVWPGGSMWLPRVESVNTVDMTGAGDAFAAAMAVGVAEGRPLVECASFANAAAALATTAVGAQTALPTRDEVLRLLDRLHPGEQARETGSAG